MKRPLFAIALLLPLLTLDAQLIRGRVVDADGKPVMGAQVQVALADRAALDFAEQDAERKSVATSEDGRYEVAAPPFGEAEHVAVEVTLPAHATVRSAPFPVGSGELRIDVALPRFVPVTVRVADRAGKRLPEARVAFAAAEETSQRERRLRMHVREALLQAQLESGTTRTNDAGEIVLHLVPGAWAFAVAADGFQATTLAERTIEQATTVAVALEPAVSIRGRVHRQGTGVQGVDVSLLEGKRTSRREPIVTDANGAFQVPGLAPGKYRLRFEKTWELLGRTVEAKAPSTVDVALPPAGTLRMHVVDAGTRKPVRELRYAIEPVDTPETAEAEHREYGTDTEDGIVTMTLSAGAYRLSANAAGYRRTQPVEVQVSEKGPADVTIELDHGAVFTGRVSDENDTPVAGAAVSVKRAKPEEWRIAPEEAHTDADGSFKVSGVDTGPVNVIVQKDGFVPFRKTVEAEMGTADVAVRLTRGLTIEGLVQRGGKPVAGVEVRAATSGLGGADQPALTDARGKFVLSGLIAARYSVTASLGSESTHIDDVDPARTRELVLSLDPPPAGVLYGVVSGVPATPGGKIKRLVVIARSEEGSAEGMIDQAGNYRIEAVPAGSVYVRAELESASGNRTSLARHVDVIAGQELRLDLELGAYLVRGRVLHDGKPAAGVEIFFGNGSGGFGSATSRADGAYEVALPVAGTYSISVQTDLVATGQLQIVREVRGGDTIDIELREQAVEGTVVEAATGRPLEGIMVTLVADAMGQSFAGEMATDANGRFRILTAGSGSHRIIAWGPGYVHRSQSLQLSGTSREVVAFELPKADELRVRVVDAGTGTPLRGHVIAASADGSLLPMECSQHADGISYVCWLSAGTYRLTVMIEGYADREVEAHAPGTMDVPMK
jgi:Carboxypeptidase regulatory-like domain